MIPAGVGILRWKRKDGTLIEHPLITLPADLQPYSAFELLPIFSFSLLSIEDTDVFCDASRFKLFHWPLRMTSGGGPDREVESAYSSFRRVYVRL